MTSPRRHRSIPPLLLLLLATGFGADRPADPEIGRLRKKIDGILRQEMKAHWFPAAVEEIKGGFHQEFAADWSPRPDPNRFLVYQARMTWTAAAFARYSPGDRDAFSGYARHGVAFLDRTMRDAEQGGFHWSLGVDGKVDPLVGAEKHVYGTAFALFAASEAYEVTRDEAALRVARDAFAWLERHAHDPVHGGYFESLTRDGRPIPAPPDDAPMASKTDRLGVFHGYKSMNSHIHLLEAMAAYYKADPTPAGRARLAELLGIVRDKVAVEPGALYLYLTRDWRAVPAHDSFGHDVETAYLLVEAAEALGLRDDAPTWKVARRLVDHALDFGWDDRDGGFYDKGDAFAAAAYDTTKVWWTQAEGLNALLLMHTKYGATTPRYWDAFRKQWSFIESHQIDPVHGGWYWETSREGKPFGVSAKANQWKANYHTGRALMNVATMLGAIEAAPSR